MFHAWLHAMEGGRRDREIALGRVAVRHGPDMRIDAEDLLHHHDAGLGLAGGLGHVRRKVEAVGGLEVDETAHVGLLVECCNGAARGCSLTAGFCLQETNVEQVLLVTGASRGIGAATALAGGAQGLCGRGQLRRQLGGGRRGGGRNPRRPAARPSRCRPTWRRKSRCWPCSSRSTPSWAGSPPWSTTPASSTCTARVDEMSVARLKRMFDINVIGSHRLRARGDPAHEHAPRRQRRRHRQRLQRRLAPGLAGPVRRLRGGQGRDRRLHASGWPRKSRPKASASTRCGRA